MKLFLIFLILIPNFAFAESEIGNITYKYPSEDIQQITKEQFEKIKNVDSKFKKDEVMIGMNNGKVMPVKKQNKKQIILNNVEKYLYIQSISTSDKDHWSIIVNNISINDQSKYKRIGNVANIISVHDNIIIIELIEPNAERLIKAQEEYKDRIKVRKNNEKTMYFVKLKTNEILNLDYYTITGGNMSRGSYYIAR